MDKKRKKLELSRVRMAKEELLFKIEERLEEVERLKEHVKLQEQKEQELQKDSE